MADPKPPRLRRCPFCGGKAELHGLDNHWGICCECLATGPEMDDAGDAARAWNKRVKR